MSCDPAKCVRIVIAFFTSDSKRFILTFPLAPVDEDQSRRRQGWAAKAGGYDQNQSFRPGPVCLIDRIP